MFRANTIMFVIMLCSCMYKEYTSIYDYNIAMMHLSDLDIIIICSGI